MAFSSGIQRMFGELAAWVAVAGVGAVVLLNFDQFKALTSKSLNAHSAKITQPEQKGRKPAGAASEETRTTASGPTVELRASDNGHFHTEAEINGRPIQVMVDTGASMIALTWEDAERAGIFLKDSDFTHAVSTANGTGRVAPITLDRVSIGDITVRNVRAAVAEPGRLQTTLLGMTFLSKLARFDMRSGVLTLQE